MHMPPNSRLAIKNIAAFYRKTNEHKLNNYNKDAGLEFVKIKKKKIVVKLILSIKYCLEQNLCTVSLTAGIQYI